jgi:acylphosphatase
MKQRQAHLLIRGKVQGVFFRESTRQKALELSLAGWVRNLQTGDVEAVAEGESPKLEQWIEWCRKGPPLARVSEVVVTYGDARGELKSFSVTE